ncbi:hypothetical protein [Ornithinibacillus scapharcae]|nr:hypothetical protein [Ornithinibacillus scapharcae]
MKKALLAFFLITFLFLTGGLISTASMTLNQYDVLVLNDEEPDPWS